MVLVLALVVAVMTVRKYYAKKNAAQAQPAAAPPAADAAPELFFQPMNFLNNLQYMGIGMLVIFVIIGVIIGATMLINYLSSE